MAESERGEYKDKENRKKKVRVKFYLTSITIRDATNNYFYID